MSNTEKPGKAAPGAAMTGRRRRQMTADDPIAAGLRRMWADAEQEPVPDDLLALLDRIDASGGSPTGNTGQGNPA